MAIEPVDFLVAPKFLAMIVMMPCLTLWANSMGILGGRYSVSRRPISPGSVHTQFARPVFARHRNGPDQERDVWHYDYGGGCHEGLSTEPGRRNWAINDAGVVISIFMVIAVAALQRFFSSLEMDKRPVE